MTVLPVYLWIINLHFDSIHLTPLCLLARKEVLQDASRCLNKILTDSLLSSAGLDVWSENRVPFSKVMQMPTADVSAHSMHRDTKIKLSHHSALSFFTLPWSTTVLWAKWHLNARDCPCAWTGILVWRRDAHAEAGLKLQHLESHEARWPDGDPFRVEPSAKIALEFRFAIGPHSFS